MVEVLERVVLHLVEQLTTDVEGCTLGEEHRLRPGDGDRSTHHHREREHPDPDVDRSFLVAGHHPLVNQIADQRRVRDDAHRSDEHRELGDQETHLVVADEREDLEDRHRHLPPRPICCIPR
jgi:hypothetical protein